MTPVPPSPFLFPEAAVSIDEVRSGDAITATLLAPEIKTVSAFDSAMATEHPYPATPDSVVPEVLAEAAAAYADLLDARAEMAVAITHLLAEFAAVQAEAATSVADARADVIDAAAAMTAAGTKALADDVAQAQAQMKEGSG